MKKLGWTMGVLQYPPALHLDVTGLTTKSGVIDDFIKASLKIKNTTIFRSANRGTYLLKEKPANVPEPF